MECRCDAVVELTGNEATDYAEGHLELVSEDVDRWETIYRCPKTGKKWLMDYPHSYAHGGGPARLRPTD